MTFCLRRPRPTQGCRVDDDDDGDITDITKLVQYIQRNANKIQMLCLMTMLGLTETLTGETIIQRCPTRKGTR